MSGGRAARVKGQRFQREVARMLEADGWHVQNIGSGVTGTDLIARRDGTTLYVETKRRERLKLPEWWAQASGNCPFGAQPLLVVKQSNLPVLWVTSEPPQ